MARLNIEDPFFLEIMQIGSSIGDQDRAIGNAIRFFRYAQEKHKAGEFITEAEFKALGFLEELFPLFAERTENGIQAAGASKHFGWLRSKSEAGSEGGKKSAETRRKKYGSAQPTGKKPRSTAEAPPKQNRSKSKHAEASSSSSITFSKEKEAETPPAEDSNQPKGTPTSRLIAAYCTAWKAKYKARPEIGGKEQGILNRLLDGRTEQRVAALIGAYLRLDDKWFIEKRHDLATLEQNLVRVGHFLDSGSAPQARHGTQAPIRYPTAEEVFAEQEAARMRDTGGPAMTPEEAKREFEKRMKEAMSKSQMAEGA